MGELIRYDAVHKALDPANRVDEVKQIRNLSVAAQAYARQAKDRELLDKATDLRLRAEIKGGELLGKIEKNKGATTGKTGVKRRPVLDKTPTLKDLGITKS